MKLKGIDLIEYAKKKQNQTVQIRRRIHQNPETGFDVYKTADLVAAHLKKNGFDVKEGVGRTGVVGDLIVNDKPEKIAFRADMDALDMTERTDVSYQSQINGKAHCCGHDVHTATLLGTAEILSELKDKLDTNIRLIFQPSEEQLPGGALPMIEDGVLDGVDEIYGMHVNNMYPVGNVGLCSGPVMAQPDNFTIRIVGKGGHAAVPHLTVDPILIGSQVVTALHGIISRNCDPLSPVVISVTKFNAGTSYNVIPPYSEIEGTVRTLDKHVQELVKKRIKEVLEGICNAHGADFEYGYMDGYPVTVNAQRCVEYVIETGEKYISEGFVLHPVKPLMVGEDFGYYSKKIRSCFIWLGSGNSEAGLDKSLHDPEFNVDETCMIYGMALLAGLAMCKAAI